MGQYFMPVNVTRNEYVNLPGPMKPVERITNAVAMGMFGYLFFEGPLDGCPRLPTAHSLDDDELQDEIDEFIEREKEKVANSEHHNRSSYQTDDGSWDRQRIERRVLSGYEISDALTYAGRWAGDDVRFVGDYADSGLYGATKATVDVRPLGWNSYDGVVTLHGKPMPVVEGSWNESGRYDHVIEDKQLEVGDYVPLSARKDDRLESDTYGLVVDISNDWTDITEGVRSEFTEVVGEEWMDQHGR